MLPCCSVVQVDKMCLEPTSFTVKEDSQFKGGDSEFVKTKLMTRLTYTLDGVSAWQPHSHDMQPPRQPITIF